MAPYSEPYILKPFRNCCDVCVIAQRKLNSIQAKANRGVAVNSVAIVATVKYPHKSS